MSILLIALLGLYFSAESQICLWALSAKLLTSFILKTDNDKEAFNSFILIYFKLIFI